MIKESGIVERLRDTAKFAEGDLERDLLEAATLIAELHASLCDGCGSSRTDEQCRKEQKSCCPDRKMLDIAAWRSRALAAESSLDRVRETTWQPIETAPKDGTEINGYRPDQGVFTFRWAFMDELVSHDQNGDPVEDFNDHEGWWHDRWGWMEGELSPTHWQPLPATPPQHTDAVAPSRAAGGDA